jgi:predicted TIM-barrel fold metal-dependent hydrolase
MRTTLAFREVTVCLLTAALLAAGCKSSDSSHTGSRAAARSASGPAAGSGSGAAPEKTPPPIIDSHVHITPTPEAFNTALQIFDQVGVTHFAVKSAGAPGGLRFSMTAQFAGLLGEKMAFFSNLDWDDIDDPGWGKREADSLERAMRAGASGVKIFKALGLGVRLKNGKLLRIDDKRLEPIWRRAGKLGAIVAWHVADPVAFFKKVDKNNERYEELSLAPEWSFYGKDYPSHDELLAQRDKVVASHPGTTFLGIHLANYPENLDYVGRLLDRCPNFYVDVSARLGEIGRHPPQKVRKFFIKYQDRILFGSDLIVTPRGMQLGSTSEHKPDFDDAVRFYADHRRFFETAERQIDHPTPIQGRWKIDAINLPPAVLRKVYVDNAERLIFRPRRAWLRRQAARKPKAEGRTGAGSGAGTRAPR